MWILVIAVATASLLGSMHCVGMCGPLAIWASGGGDRFGRTPMLLATTLYHFGRMVTYALAGLIAGSLGQLVDLGGEALGFQLVAARIVGLLMIAMGLYRLWPLVSPACQGLLNRLFGGLRGQLPAADDLRPDSPSPLGAISGNPTNTPPPQAVLAPQPTGITKLLMRLRPLVFRLPLPARGLATGLLTAFLPCGWLYLFALVAAGTGSMLTGPIVMLAFWLGTVPLLVALVAGTQTLALRYRRLVPAGASILLIMGGCYTATGRGFSSLNALTDLHTASRLAAPTPRDPDFAASEQPLDVAAEMQVLVNTPLPCCVAPPKDATPSKTSTTKTSRTDARTSAPAPSQPAGSESP